MNLSDFETLQAAKDYTEINIVRIQGAERKTAVETVNIFNGTRDRLDSYVPPDQLSPEQQAQASVLAKMIVKAFDNLFNPEFYIALDNVQVQQAYAGALSLGVLTQVEYDGILDASQQVLKPFENATLHDFKIAKNDLTRFKEVNVNQNTVFITVDTSLIEEGNPDLEPHRPQIYFKIGENYQRVAGFTQLVDKNGSYNTVVPTRKTFVEGVYVDNAYGVIS